MQGRRYRSGRGRWKEEGKDPLPLQLDFQACAGVPNLTAAQPDPLGPCHTRPVRILAECKSAFQALLDDAQ